jgi:competence protein ComEC
VHAASGKRLGEANPRQEGPTDLRLVQPALAAWATAALALDVPPGWVTGVAVVCSVVAGVLLLVRRTSEGSGLSPVRQPRWGSWSRVSVAGVLLCVAAAAVSAGLHGADLRRGPVPELARQYAGVTAELEVTSDPRLTRPRIQGAHAAPSAVLLDAEIRRIESTDGSTTATRTPVLVTVDVSAKPTKTGPFRRAPAEAAGGPERSPWLGLLPSTRLRVTGRLVPALTSGDRIAAVLRVRGRAGPEGIS